jgi:bis(5'-nucleosidyl)-tetraphosphatase
MPIEKSAGAIIFRKESFDAAQGKGDKIFYLLLHYPSNAKAPKEYWDLSKGHIEKGESELETVKREVEEETGLKDIEFVEGFKEWIKYFFKWESKNILKFVTFYLAETETRDVKISGEHIGYEWLPYKEAIEKLTFKNAKEILKKANEFLSKTSSQRG